MKMILAALTLAFSLQSFALDLHCDSATYNIVVKDVEAGGKPIANYGINNYMNDAADVEIGDIYVSNRVIALSLTVDRQPGKFEVSASIAPNKKKFEGKIFSDKKAQAASCSIK